MVIRWQVLVGRYIAPTLPSGYAMKARVGVTAQRETASLKPQTYAVYLLVILDAVRTFAASCGNFFGISTVRVF